MSRQVTTRESDTVRSAGGGVWLRRAGLAGLAFFLLKGLAWLVVPLAFYNGCIAG